MAKALLQHYRQLNVPQSAQPAVDKPGIISIIKRQSNEDMITYILTRAAGALIIINIINQAGKLKGWW